MTPLIETIVYYCRVNSVQHIDIEGHIFNRLTISSKVTVKDLARALANKFQFTETDALLLARYMIE